MGNNWPSGFCKDCTVGAADFGWLEHDLLFFFKTPPYGPGERGEIDPNTRWFTRLTIN